MDSEDGELFIKQLASFVRTHEKALANALQFRRQTASRHGSSQSVSSIPTPLSPTVPERPSTSASTSSGLASALSLGSLNFTSHNVKSAKLALTPHHLFYLLSRFEELAIPVGPMKIRLENLHDSSTSANYVSFLSNTQRSRSRGSDVGSIHSVSSVRSVMSGMSALWASFGIGASISAARTERQKAAIQADLKYLYSAFTKIPCLRLAPDWRARLIRGYEEFPFDSAVPLYVFKNVQALEVNSIDFRQFFGWDRMAEQLRSLTLKRAGVEDPADILIDIVLDDMDKRRRRTSKQQSSPTTPWPASSSPRRSPALPHADLHKSPSAPCSPDPRNSIGDLGIGSLNVHDDVVDEGLGEGRRPSLARADTFDAMSPPKGSRPRSNSPTRPVSSRNHSHMRGGHKVRRSGSGSSHSSLSDSWHHSRTGSSSNLLGMSVLPASKWRFLKHLSLADNSMTSIPATSLVPLANTLHSLDLSSNLFTQIPDSLATLTALRALNLSHCMIDGLHSLTRNPLPAISALNLRANRLQSIAGIEKLYPLERLDLRDNRLSDPLELARLTGIPDIREIWVEGNPFTRTHKDYRITIFNLFRQTPGYTEDIVIDNSGPTYSERRYLVDRTPVPAAVPVVKPAPADIPAVDVSKPAIIYDIPKEPSVLRKERPVPKAVTSEVNTSSTRRRKTPKRRIVDLSTANASATVNPGVAPVAPSLASTDVRILAADATATAAGSDNNYRISEGPEVSQLPSTVLSESRKATSQPEVPRIDTSVMPELPPTYTTHDTPPESSEWDVSGEMYRRKIEALRDKVGNGYLSVLSEEGWDPSRPPTYTVPDFSPVSTVRPSPTTPRTTTTHHTPAIHSGRTLG
ncbi:putative leucine-rich repeat-containing protein [Colletotrichum chlorophyti]|uniref:Putative leucine-rich repeat-containing protein n=1 Tax=Colletotrichum chlorophyti TaxID=708187 RepID=A0A1Q8S0A9_9PEZI|nr:putative leucine-rich repeat-containing protein [Colletotrichum chlorophyti]